MIGETDGLASNHVSWAKRRKDAILVREAVEPEHHGINNLRHEGSWDANIYLDQFHVH